MTRAVDTRLENLKVGVRRIPRERRVLIHDVPLGSIVKLPDGRFCVAGPIQSGRKNHRRCSFWDGPDEFVDCVTIVDVEPRLVLA